MAWAEFAYKVALGEIKHGEYLYKCGIRDIENLFPKKTKPGWTVQYLLTCNDSTYQPRRRGRETDAKDFQELAFGTLLHMIEDSFSRSHVDRRPPVAAEKCEKCEELQNCYQPGKIVSFHAFANQKLRRHGMKDNRGAYLDEWHEGSVTVVDVGRVLKSYYENGKDWDELKKYLECIFSLEDEDAKAGPGDYAAH
jgi:hypothetical protein